PRWAVEIIPTLTPGIAVWDVNGNVQVVKHLITETERPLVFTDRAMTESSVDPDDLGFNAELLAAEQEAEERAAMMEQHVRAHYPDAGHPGYPESTSTVA
ncbi:ATP/GTP-binding protein, partial [Streptomyces albidoflavus]